MNEPTRRTIDELKQENFVDWLMETYPSTRNNAGDPYPNALVYTTNENTYMASDNERAFIEKHGLAPIGFLELLRAYMANTSGFGICVSNNALKKAMAAMSIDYNLELDEMQKSYNLLLEGGLLIIISDSKQNKYATTAQQVFNWEYKQYTRWKNNKYQQNHRNKNKDKDKEMTEVPPVPPELEAPPTAPPLVTVPTAPAPKPTGFDDDTSVFGEFLGQNDDLSDFW